MKISISNLKDILGLIRLKKRLKRKLRKSDWGLFKICSKTLGFYRHFELRNALLVLRRLGLTNDDIFENWKKKLWVCK
jgi:hypothetical protein